MSQPLQPFLHDLVTVLAAPTQVLSDRTGDLDAAGRPVAEGVLHADVRVLCTARVEVDGRVGEHIATVTGAGGVTFTALLRDVGVGLGRSADPQVRLDRERTVTPGALRERLRLTSVLPQDVPVTVSVAFAGDLASIEAVKAGRPAVPQPLPDPVGDALTWGGSGVTATLRTDGGRLGLCPDRRTATATWSLLLPATGSVEVGWSLDLEDEDAVVVAAPAATPRPARPSTGWARGWTGPWPTWTACGWHGRPLPRTSSTPPAPPGT